MRLSRLFIPTLKEAPSDAVTISNKLMLRAALARKISNGLYTYLPLGAKVLNKISNIIHKEMEALNSNEFIIPTITSKELIADSQKIERLKKELLKLKYGNDADIDIATIDEDAFIMTAQNEIQSYKDFPLILYQIHKLKTMSSKESIMKNAYSFHIKEESLDETYNDIEKKYSNIFKKVGLNTVSIISTGKEYMILNESGDKNIICCSKCGYMANAEKADVKNEEIANNYTDKPLEEVYTPNIGTINDLEKFFNTTADNFIKSIIYRTEEDEVILVVIRGDLAINEAKLCNTLGVLKIELADEDTVKEVTGAKVGFASPIGLKKKVRIFADNTIKSVSNAIVGGNKDDIHIKNVNINRDFNIDVWGDFRMAKDGDKCPECGEVLHQKNGFKLGHILKLGNKYTEALNFKVLDENNKETVPIMGCYCIDISKVFTSIIEQNYDDKGIVFPISVAPYEAIVVAIDKETEDSFKKAEEIYKSLNDICIETIFDDRKERLGVKLNDCDLIGIPMRIIVGKKSLQRGVVEFKLRNSSESVEVKAEEIIEYVKTKKDELLSKLQ